MNSEVFLHFYNITASKCNMRFFDTLASEGYLEKGYRKPKGGRDLISSTFRMNNHGIAVIKEAID